MNTDLLEVLELPMGPGLYTFWRDGQRVYIGKAGPTVGIRTRVLGHLHLGGKKRPNETLYLAVLDWIRPDMSQDPRTCVQIATEWLRECRVTAQEWDGVLSLGVWETQQIREHRPLLNAWRPV